MVSTVSPQAQQSIPAANTFQPGGTESVRNQAYEASKAPNLVSNDDSSKVSASASRGTQLDVTA